MKFSIIIPVYNDAGHISKALDSVRNQIYNNFECIIVDDGSTDNLKNIVKNYTGDSRFIYKQNPHIGRSYARNTGIDMSTGEWITFLDADDWMQNDRLTRLAGFINTNPDIQIFWNSTCIWKNGKHVHDVNRHGNILWEMKDNRLLSRSNWDIGYCWDKIYKSDLLKKNNIRFPEGVWMCEDTLFNILCYAHAKKIKSVNIRLSHHIIKKYNNIDNRNSVTGMVWLYNNVIKKFQNDADTNRWLTGTVRDFFHRSWTWHIARSKTVLCAIVKNENRYLDEWMDYYIKLGFDNIILYDNNDTDGEVINVKNDIKDKVYIIDKRSVKINQSEIYNDFIHDFGMMFNWAAFFDCDEFLQINTGQNFKRWLDNRNKFDCIFVNWKLFGDNNLIYYDSRPIRARFTVPAEFKYNPDKRVWWRPKEQVKSIVNCRSLDRYKYNTTHKFVFKNGRYCSSSGRSIDCPVNTPDNWSLKQADYAGAELNHYITKTIEEFVMRRTQTYNRTTCEQYTLDLILKDFACINTLTADKIKAAEDTYNKILHRTAGL